MPFCTVESFVWGSKRCPHRLNYYSSKKSEEVEFYATKKKSMIIIQSDKVFQQRNGALITFEANEASEVKQCVIASVRKQLDLQQQSTERI